MARALNENFFNKFKDTDGVFHKFVVLVQMDRTLDLELRGNCVEIYYRGGMLFRIKDGNDNCVETTKEYLNFDSSLIGNSLVEICKVNPEIEYAIENVASYKQAIDFHLSGHNADEKEFQQLIERSNNYISTAVGTDYYIADIEYACNNTEMSARFDMVALYWQSESGKRKIRKNKTELPLTFIEVKYGDGSLKDDSGMKKHVSDFIKVCRNGQLIEELCDDMTLVFRQKHSMGLVPGYKGAEANIKVVGNDLRLLFIVGDHDPSSSIMNHELKAIISEEKENADILKKIHIAIGSCMGYGLFALDGDTYRYPNIYEFVRD